MEYFFATNVFRNKLAGPFVTYESAVAAGLAAPKEHKPVSVEKVTFCNTSGDPCPECLRVTEVQIERTNSQIEATKKLFPKELHQ